MKRDRDNTADNVKILLKLMEWNRLSDRELDLLESFQEQFEAKGQLSDAQFEALNDIFDRANAR